MQGRREKEMMAASDADGESQGADTPRYTSHITSLPPPTEATVITLIGSTSLSRVSCCMHVGAKARQGGNIVVVAVTAAYREACHSVRRQEPHLGPVTSISDHDMPVCLVLMLPSLSHPSSIEALEALLYLPCSLFPTPFFPLTPSLARDSELCALPLCLLSDSGR